MVAELPPQSPQPPASLARHLYERRCVLFVGAGLSSGGKFPTWEQLLATMVERLKAENPAAFHLEELDDLLKAGKLLEVADYCKEKLGPRHYSDVLRNQLRTTITDIPKPHELIFQLPFSAVITTNYDKLLERAYFSRTKDLPQAPTYQETEELGQMLFNNEFFILKAHGDIDRPKDMVLTAKDYRELIHSNLAYNELMSAILLTKCILFVGYSIRDPDFRLLLDRHLVAFRGATPERYALMRGVGMVECDVLQQTAGIRVITYRDHEDIVGFLEALQRDVLRFSLARGGDPGIGDLTENAELEDQG